MRRRAKLRKCAIVELVQCFTCILEYVKVMGKLACSVDYVIMMIVLFRVENMGEVVSSKEED